MSRKFDCKEATVLDEGFTIKFNGASISIDKGSYCIYQPDHTAKRGHLPHLEVSVESFVFQRARGAYIAAVGRPGLPFGFAHVSKVLKADESCIRFINHFIQLAKENTQLSLKFVPIYSKFVCLAVSSEASFASDADMTSQLGYVITLADASEKPTFCIIHQLSPSE